MPLLLDETYALGVIGNVIGVFVLFIYSVFVRIAWILTKGTTRSVVIIIMLLIGLGIVNFFFV
ncbi:hypothetical protein HNQ93_000022 [Hymenobacter luteus]|uniref:Uncharacterized protein n=2 Tax=Hymenobacter TaxID=89966 RepID=A0A7W9SWJ4_9BACT|nr:hypothetical protein [Hymenobacter latericoloratus]MBB6057192.1 hypothetical protein [Hymenobacter luteus]